MTKKDSGKFWIVVKILSDGALRIELGDGAVEKFTAEKKAEEYAKDLSARLGGSYRVMEAMLAIDSKPETKRIMTHGAIETESADAKS